MSHSYSGVMYGILSTMDKMDKIILQVTIDFQRVIFICKNSLKIKCKILALYYIYPYLCIIINAVNKKHHDKYRN